MKTATRRGVALSCALAFVAGFVDAIGFIETGGLFVSFMSGNSTQASVETLQGNFHIALLSAYLLICFVAGVTIAGTVAARAADHRPYVVGGAGVALAGVAITSLLGAGSPWTYGLVAAAMGSLNTLYLADGRARIAITYATGTLVSLGLSLAALVTGKSRTAWRRPLLLWGSLAVGAVAGATSHFIGTTISLFAAAIVLGVLAVLIAARPGRS